MTKTMPQVEIPADVKDNSTYTVRVQWRSVRPAHSGEVESAIVHLDTFGYTMHRWDDEDKDGNRVTLHRFVNRTGQTVDLYATYYYTRVKCTDCDYSYAQSFIAVTDSDGVTHPAAPFCGEHGYMVKRIANHQPGYTWDESERLIVGQHH